jgi:dihydroorotate dehydrogenase
MIPDLALIPKFNLSIKPETISALKKYCDAFCLTNTLGFKEKEDGNWWKKLFPKEKSPLIKRFNGKFNGGLSGAPLFPLLIRWLEEMQKHDKSISIIAGGGIMNRDNIDELSKFKIVKGIALGSVTTLRPWRLQSLIDYGNEVFGRKYYSNSN